MGFIKKFQCQLCQGIVETEFDDDYVICGHCDSACQVPKEFGPGSVIDDFVVVALLGEGGMGNVYLAHQFSLDRKVALKILKDDFMKDPKFKDEFIYEARNVACLNHPNIIQAYKVGEEAGMVFFAMEYVEGRNLKDILKEEGAINEKLAISIAMEIVEALGYAWNLRKLVHRDIKPENIMMTNDGTAKLMDLGLSLRDGDDKDEGDMIAGTPQYISPEQVLGTEMDIRGDFYCLGATLYHLVSGKMPFEGSLQQIVKSHLSDKPASLRKVVPGIDDFFAKIIHKMLSKKPENRYANAEELLAAFRKDMKLIEDAEHGKTHFKVNTQTNIKAATTNSTFIRRRKRKDPLLVASLVMLAVLLGGFFLIRIFMSGSNSSKPKPQNKVVETTKVQSTRSPDKSENLLEKVSIVNELFYNYYHWETDNKGRPRKKFKQLGESKNTSIIAPDGRKENYAIHYEGFITLPYSETYLFYLKADDSVSLFIDGILLGTAGNDEKKLQITLDKGSHLFQLVYTQRTRHKGLTFDVESVSVNRTKVPESWFTTYNVSNPPTVDESKPGLDYELYNDTLFPGAHIKYFPDSKGNIRNFSELVTKTKGTYLTEFMGLLKVPKAGRYTFYLTANDSAQLFINDSSILGDGSKEGASKREILLNSEVNNITVRYLQKSNSPLLKVEIEGEGVSRQEIPAEWFFRETDQSYLAMKKAMKLSQVLRDQPYGNLQYTYYEGNFKNNFKRMLGLKFKERGNVNSLNFLKGHKKENYGLEFLGQIRIPKTGRYNFYLNSDDHSELSIDGKPIVKDASGGGSSKGTISLVKGQHKFQVIYTQGSGDRALSLEIESAEIRRTKIPRSWYSLPKVAPKPKEGIKQVEPVKDKVRSSAVTIKSNEIMPTQEAIDQTFESGMRYTLYRGEFENLDEMLKGKVISKDNKCANIDMETHSGSLNDNFGLVYEGYFNFKSDKTHVLGLFSNDGSRLYLEDKLVIDHDGNHIASEKKATLTLKRGVYKFRLEYFQGQKDKDLIFRMKNTGGKMISIKDNYFVRKKAQ